MAVPPQEAIEKLFYAAKFPMKEYRLRQRVRPGNRPGTWEKLRRFKQEKEDIRPGIAARLATKLACFTMHEILFGGGAGVGIVSIALKNAERRIKIEQQEAFARRFRLAFGRQPQ
ncbi:hypothetical protein NKH36_34050 [Mesorhizobium sp. M1312]|uniref:hypothetical protein n=1 Tax=unclassified Mesorhizobium TaxID=325217 RepID=UPI0033356463